MNALWQELRHALRAVLRARGLTAATVLQLIGAGLLIGGIGAAVSSRLLSTVLFETNSRTAG